MFREDYLRRMIEQATAVVTVILGLVSLERYPEALTEVDRALQRLVGLNLSLVAALPAAELVALTRWGERLDVGKLAVLAELLQAEGDITTAQGQVAEGRACYLKALEIVLEVAFDAEQHLTAVQPRVAALLERLAAADLPPDLAEWLAHYQATVAALPAEPAAG